MGDRPRLSLTLTISCHRFLTMPRRARLSIPEVPWHIIQRGNNRAVCFYAEPDYRFYLHYLKKFAE